MAPLERNNYFKLVSLIVDIACNVIVRYIREKIVWPNNFTSFLDIREERHKLVHVYETSKCCECVSEKIKGERLISKQQLLLLYKSEKTKQNRNHQKYVGGQMTQICICNYSAIENIDVNVVDITLANYIIQKCGKHEPGMDNWMEQIKDVRNEIYHLSDIQEITNKKFRRKWEILEGSILGIANLIDTACVEETEKQILQIKKIAIIPDFMLKHEILCRDYWRNKCAEFEEEQMQEIEKKATALQYKMKELFGGTTEKVCKKKMQKIHMQRVHIPVFLQLDLPISWDKTKVFEVIDEMRLKGTPDMNIRIKAISTDDFTILAEIAKKILHNVHELSFEINQLMSNLLSEAAIDTTQPDEVCVNITILDKAETLRTMVEKINILTNIFGNEDNIEMPAATELENEDKKHNKTTEGFQKLLSLYKEEAYQMDLKAEFKNSIFLDESLICRFILTNFQNIFNNIDILKKGLHQAMENRKPNCAKAIAWTICRQYTRTVTMAQYYDIWPGFECGCHSKNRSDDLLLCSRYIVIVAEVHKMEMISHKKETFFGIPIVYKEVNGHSDEAMSLIGEVESTIDARKPYETSQHVSSEQATEYFTKHSKLTMISKSHLKSKGFGEENIKIERIPCIQFFCRAKGIIPIGEPHFPYNIGSIQTDIFEGFPTLQAKQIRIGSEFFVKTGEQNESNNGQNATAVPNNVDDEMDIYNDVNLFFKGRAGTIGGFLKYNGEDAFLTCAHVILSPYFLISHTFGYELHENPVKIYCKDDESLIGVIPCGYLANITFPPNEIYGVSIDAAIVKIDQNRAKIHIEDAEKRELKSNYLHKCCLDWQEVGVHADFEVRTFGAVSLDQHIKDRATIIDGQTVEFETLNQAVENVYRDINPANTQNNIHFAFRAVDIVSKRHSNLPQSIIFRNQIGMQKIKFQQGDSGMCIYVRHTDGKFWCIGMAIATHPAGGCIITPLKAILKHFNY